VVYVPLNLIVANPEKKEEILQDMYDDFKVGVGVGFQSFYDKVRMKYLNITRDEVKKFLKNQTYYQLTKGVIKTTNKPIVVSYPNERWSADLIDMNQYTGENKNNRYILTIIDNFSKYVFATPLKNKEAATIAEGFEKIVTEQADNTYPSSIQTDNGAEFEGEFIQWCRNNNILIKKSLSYSPTSNSLIENFNNILRKMIREGFVRTNSFNWVDYLQDYLTNRNNSKHSLIKYPPAMVWKPLRERIYNDDVVDEVKYNIKESARRKMQLNRVEMFEVGDKVRVLLSSLFSKIRKLLKSNLQKLVPVKYSPNIYTIEKVKIPRGEKRKLMKERYILQMNGATILNKDKPQLFYGSELQKVEKVPDEQVITQKEAMKLNLLKNQYLFDEDENINDTRVEEITRPPRKEKPRPEPINEEPRRGERVRKARDILDL